MRHGLGIGTVSRARRVHESAQLNVFKCKGSFSTVFFTGVYKNVSPLSVYPGIDLNVEIRDTPAVELVADRPYPLPLV